MAKPLSAEQIITALRNEGLTVVEHRSWRTHHRNAKGPWGPVHGVMIHHTVTSGDTAKQTAASVELCYNGHSSLPGPLCHGVIDKAGTVHLVGNGRTNHAGRGDSDVLAAVIAERVLPPDNKEDTDGNPHFYGFELINRGDGKDPWPSAQTDAAVRASAALSRAHGWSERSVIAHKEWQPGKIDPTFPMDSFRVAVGRRLRAAPVTPKPTPAPEKNASTAMALTADDKTWIIKAIKDNTSLIMLRTDGQYLAPKDADDWSPDVNDSRHWWSGTTVFDSLVTTTRENRIMLLAIMAHLGIEPAE